MQGAQPRGHLCPISSLHVFPGADSSRKGLGSQVTSWSDQLGHPRVDIGVRSQSLLLAATHSPGDRQEMAPTAGPAAPVAQGTAITGHGGEVWCRGWRGCGGHGAGGNAGLWDLWPSLVARGASGKRPDACEGSARSMAPGGAVVPAGRMPGVLCALIVLEGSLSALGSGGQLDPWQQQPMSPSGWRGHCCWGTAPGTVGVGT